MRESKSLAEACNTEAFTSEGGLVSAVTQENEHAKANKEKMVGFMA